ncbi:multidrug ABC transporter substrate-binding protein [Cephaloticoccus primus]|uniref:Multidrug ABC transporter substrate-binding protein n=1 Tax=Cephaloticoccus primus TaxID=1548207 RepID=A0A139SLP4_9BACT|nr:ABC transporter permease [Cephaloticoccus primus]KXU35467.1 multidrug ABC transporter substrate-binding protein [Cephaloticoccus primus]
MRIGITIAIAFQALRRNVMRSTLTALGIIIGVAAVIAMVGIGNGAKSQVEAQIAGLGQNIILVWPGTSNTGGLRGGWGSGSSLTRADATAIAREIPGVIGVSSEMRSGAQVVANGLNWRTQVYGEEIDYLQIRSWPLASGVMFTEQEQNRSAKVAVIGQTVAEQLFPDEDPIGKTIRLFNFTPLRVIGVLSPKGFNSFGQDQDDVVIIPITSFLSRITWQRNLASILVQADAPEHMERIQEGIHDLLAERRPGGRVDFTVRNQVEIAEAATATTRTMTLLLGAIAGVSLLVGGIGIMNIMLVSVTERTREIGIRLAIGARSRDVMLQFLTEAVVLSAFGGLLGISLGVGMSQLMSHLNGWPTLISSDSMLIAFAFSAAVGIFFGYYPARKAALLDPIDALRYE